MTCSKTNKISMRGFGIVGKEQCLKPVFKDGLCKKHYISKINQATPYSEREGYKEPTLEEFKSGKTLYLKTRGSHGGYRCKKGIIFKENTETLLEPNPQLFVIKITLN